MGPPDEVKHALSMSFGHIGQRFQRSSSSLSDRAKMGSPSSPPDASLHHEKELSQLRFSLSTLDLSTGSPQPVGVAPANASIMMMQRELFKKRLTKKTNSKGIQEWEVCALPEKLPERRQ